MLTYRIQVLFQFWLLRKKLRKIGLPTTYNEKIWWKSAYDRRNILTTFADKIKVRDYVAEKIGAKYLTNAIAVAYDPSKIKWAELPREFVIKVNHGSGGVVIVWDGAPHDSRLPADSKNENWTRHQIKPENLDFNSLSNLITHFLKLKYCWFPGCNRIPEWAYLNVKPGLIIEELLLDEIGQIPKDIKFWMFHGECKFISVTVTESPTQGTELSRDLFTKEWEWINVRKDGLPNSKVQIGKPANYEEMLEIAEKLSIGIDFVRVDLYSIRDRVIFGEMTNYPAAGTNSFDPPEYEKSISDIFKLDVL